MRGDRWLLRYERTVGGIFDTLVLPYRFNVRHDSLRADAVARNAANIYRNEGLQTGNCGARGEAIVNENSAREVATLGGGCFWCLEAVFEQLQGVERVESGYSGGHTPQPNYERVCGGNTGHAEVVQIVFDPAVLSFADLLDAFFSIHDPTTLNRQGADVGTQYRSAIFYHSPEQKRLAEEKIAALNAAGVYRVPVVTQVTALEAFHRAEEYHQGYFRNHPYQGYCQAVVAPKVAKFRSHFTNKLRG